MFLSLHQNSKIVIPQNEHARLAGVIASFWGNAHFDRPKIDFNSFIKGVAFHQFGYDQYDTLEIGNMKEDQFYKVFMDDAEAELGDHVAELVNLFHQQRLVKKQFDLSGKEVFDQIHKDISEIISEKIENVKNSQQEFLWANRITHVCDKISFNFSMGVEREEIIDVFPKQNAQDTINIKMQIDNDRNVYVDPWPFEVEKIESIVYAYEHSKYPQKLIPVVLQLRVMPSSL